jgi:hypothetical protein
VDHGLSLSQTAIDPLELLTNVCASLVLSRNKAATPRTGHEQQQLLLLLQQQY